MSTRICPCGASYRSGAIVHVLETDGSIRRRRVCSACAKRAVSVLTNAKSSTCRACKLPAAVCNSCYSAAVTSTRRDLKSLIAPVIKALEAQVKGFEEVAQLDDSQEQGFVLARIEGLESAIELLKREAAK